jgi:hypothetical protein
MARQFAALCILAGLLAHANAEPVSQLAKESVKDVLAAMSLEDKARLVVRRAGT